MRVSIWLRRVLPSMSTCTLMIALFGRFPPPLAFGLVLIGLGIAGYTITGLVKVYRNGNDPIDYTGWVEADDEEPQPKSKSGSDSDSTVER